MPIASPAPRADVYAHTRVSGTATFRGAPLGALQSPAVRALQRRRRHINNLMEVTKMADIPAWWMKGDWFDVCSCNVPCPCGFAQAPTNNRCEGVMAYHVREGAYGDVVLDGLNVIAVVTFEGNAWAKENPVSIGIFMDERANDAQREALQRVFSGQAGGWMGIFAELVGEVRGLEFVPIEIEIAPDLAQWRAEIPGRVKALAEALSGPTTPPGARVQLHNAPGSEVGPGQVMTWGKAVENEVDAFSHKWSWSGQSSKHIPFNWTGPQVG